MLNFLNELIYKDQSNLDLRELLLQMQGLQPSLEQRSVQGLSMNQIIYHEIFTDISYIAQELSNINRLVSDQSYENKSGFQHQNGKENLIMSNYLKYIIFKHIRISLLFRIIIFLLINMKGKQAILNSHLKLRSQNCISQLQDSTKEIQAKPGGRTLRSSMVVQPKATSNYHEIPLFQWSQIDQFFSKPSKVHFRDLFIQTSINNQTKKRGPKKIRVGPAFRGFLINRWMSNQFNKKQRQQGKRSINVQRLGLERCYQQIVYNLQKRKFIENKNLKEYSQVTQEIIYFSQAHVQLLKKIHSYVSKVPFPLDQSAIDQQHSLQPIYKLKSFTVVKNLLKSISKSYIENQIQLLKKNSLSKLVQKPKERNCQICFSYDRSPGNQIKSCKQCNTRYHLNCFKCINSVKQICQACQQRINQTQGQCYFCEVDDLPTKQCFYRGQLIQYHPACLILAQKAEYNRGAIEPITVIQEKQQYIQNYCQLCNKSKGVTKSCKDCSKTYHPLCAFFANLSLSGVRLNGLRIQLEINCCSKITSLTELEAFQLLQFGADMMS